MKRKPMFLMLLLATAMSDNQAAESALGTKAKTGADVSGVGIRGAETESSALEEAHRASLRRIKPAA